MRNKSNRLYTHRIFRGKFFRGKIFCGDALEFMQSIPSSIADVLFLDPPFNLGKKYVQDNPSLDQRPEHEYLKWIKEILTESVRVLAHGGTLYLYHIPHRAIQLGNFLDSSLNFQHWIAISMKSGFVRGRRLYPAHYALLMFTKGKPNQFNRPKLKPQKCRHCGKYIKDYGGYISIIEKKGLNLTDFWDDISPVRHHNKKHRRANELPTIIFKRAIEISGTSNGIYVDPFAGSGSGVIEAAAAGMHFLCSDLIADNCSIIESRLENLRKEKKRERIK
jgi:site-specific DNA-methyltransferase (adenine-specific)